MSAMSHNPQAVGTSEHVAMLELVCAQISQDAEADRFAHWGKSTLIDEFTGVAMIDRELSDLLHRVAGLKSEFPIGNAGLLHVYGYWFSEVPTPFGLKRDRWLRGELAEALGLPVDTFHLQHDSGRTLLDRVQSVMLPLLRRPPAGARVAEAVVDGRLTRVVVCPSPQPALSSQSSALIYGIAPIGGGQSAPISLITAFPFAGDPAFLLEDFSRNSTLRWNAVN